MRDRIIVHNDAKDPYGEAVGNVKLVDPDGTITGSNITYHWKTFQGSALNIIVKTGQLTLMADSVDIKPKLWTLHNVGGTGAR